MTPYLEAHVAWRDGRGSSNKDSGSSATSSGGDAPHKSVAELAREKKLRDDPMAQVHGPLFVTCLRCGRRIKLSPKSTYDPFHWMKHRERCLKKPIGLARAPRRNAGEIYGGSSMTSSVSSSKTDAESITPPPLTPDNDRGVSFGDVKEESPLSELEEAPPSPKSPVVPPPDHAFQDYLQQSRRTQTRDLSVNHDRWQNWDWRQLKPPAWMVTSQAPSTEGDEDEDDIMEDHDYSGDPAATFSLLPDAQVNPS
ncbi:hypothetical protein SERLA73DRAFT_75693 [Serpula lacrymans var. lacrymans S7.3]|uniref:Uncharacterized protein n=1 Tax=Serpula lacrymans var. lacrymans (strain S7.3) TaxID=936435 RepID=F8Q3Y5_SERL3|nr:hypothetical protein SERLA73DRAFT_75693 [Serpula lacrymans var. lacrymans S7.3]